VAKMKECLRDKVSFKNVSNNGKMEFKELRENMKQKEVLQ